jgi:RHS repeat-associated protein
LASVTYERQGVGEPSKITREDGSYVLLKYDSALRVEKESYYNASGQLLNETSYTYDASGKRQVQSTSGGNRTFNYSTGYQLDTVTEAGETENYDYDTDGRLTLIERDGKVLDLNHDAYDRLTTVENETTGETTQYIYDGVGNRVKAVEGTQERRFLVAPAMGGGLESTDLITDGSGNLISNYIYGGGSSPFMRLDASGNAVYYLTDAIGSVIGLADGSGASSGKFLYDAFGNILSLIGSADIDAGGDFRFQGQWLESESGLYHFRARDYDPATGLFLSRDRVDIIETEPESFNPYQFVYNNPYIYSDPTGMITSISELVSTQKIQDILSSIKTQSYSQAKQYALDELGESFTGIISNVLDRLLPFEIFDNPLVDAFGNKGKVWDIFEYIVTDAICKVFGNPDFIWFGTKLETNGKPFDNGVGCGILNPDNSGNIKLPLVPAGGSKNSADFLFTKVAPLNLSSGKTSTKKSFLLGDFKFSVKTMYERYIEKGDKSRQWSTFRNHAKRFQWVPVNSFITWSAGPKKDNLEQKLARVSAQDGVIMIITSLKR